MLLVHVRKYIVILTNLMVYFVLSGSFQVGTLSHRTDKVDKQSRNHENI